MADVMTSEITKTISGEAVNFYTPREQRIRSLKVYFSPKQAGIGTPSPDNVRPISGWTGVEIEHCGRNLFNKNNYGYYDGNSGVFRNNDAYSYFRIPVKPGDVVRTDRVTGMGLGCYFFNGEYVGKLSSFTQLTIPDGVDEIASNFNSTRRDTAVVTLNNSDVSYEPYKTKISLPKEYQEVEYLESDGSQYIDLNLGFLDTDEVEIKGAILHSNGGDKYLVSPSVWNDNTNRFAMGGGLYDKFRICFGDRGSAAQMSPSVDVDSLVHTWVYKDRKFSIDDTLSTSNVQNVTFSRETKYLKLFYGYNAPSKGQIYSYHHKKADGTEINLTPCYRKSDKKPGMYDTVSGIFYTNSGTGEFITGPAVNRYDIDWGDDVGTVYGGYVDLVSGELVKTIAMIDLKDYSFAQYSKTNHCWGEHYLSGMKYGKDIGSDLLCDSYKALTPLSILSGGENLAIWPYNTNQPRLIIRNDAYIKEDGTYDIDGLNNSLKGVIITYPLAEPITHQLSPATLSTLARDNNFWSNADRIEIEYDYIGIFKPLESRKNIMSGTPHLVTVKDSVVSFGTDMAANLKECKVWFKPKQDLHGYDKPWIGGMGKNLLDVSNADKTTNGIAFGGELSSGGTNGTLVLKAGTYTVSSSTTMELITITDSSSSIVQLAQNANSLSFTIDSEQPIRVVFYKGDATNMESYTYQLESGSSATSYEPYSNICPIEGWNGITVTRCGKNLLGGSAIVQAIANSNSTAVVNGDEVTFKAVSVTHTTPIFEKFKPNTQYTFIITGYKSQNNAYINLAVEYTDGTSDLINLPSGFTPNETYTIVRITTANKTVKCFRNHAANYQNFTLIGSLSGVFEGVLTAADYEPYESTTLTIQFPQTIYGGYVDLVKGEVVETQTKVVLDGENIKVNRAGYNSDMYYGSGWVYAIPLGLSSENGKNFDLFLCDKLPRIAPAFATVSSYSVPAAGNLYYQIRVLAKEDYPNELTATEILNLTNEWLKDNPLTMVYPLKNENTYSLTSQTIATLRGANTIWTNSNDSTEVTYYTHGDDSYQHIPTSDAITSSDDFLLVTDDGYVIGTEDDFITY